MTSFQVYWRHDYQHNDTLQNDTQHNAEHWLNGDTRHFGKKCSAECGISLCRVTFCKVSLYRMSWRHFIGRFIECLPYLFVASLVSMLQKNFPLSQRPLGQIS
jgi:hypothetical protein